MKKFLWRFCWNCGRNGELEGLFVATENDVKSIIGEEVHFGEVLGKHSNIYGPIEDGEIVKIAVDSDAIEKVSAKLGDTWCGYNPIKYLEVE